MIRHRGRAPSFGVWLRPAAFPGVHAAAWLQVNELAGAEWRQRSGQLHQFWAQRLFTRDAGERRSAGAAGGAVCGRSACPTDRGPVLQHLLATPQRCRCRRCCCAAPADITPVMFCSSLVPGAWSRQYGDKLRQLQRTLAAREE